MSNPTNSQFLSSDRYAVDASSGVWVANDLKSFAYSDGDAEENYILQALKASKDVSCASNELSARMKDWPSEYHLSAARRNVLAPLKIKKGSTVLELGCGMGAITRYLGELGADVIALEGSPRRAAIARERCRDLSRVTVVCDNIKNFRSDQRFDIVTLIGVMEYSPKFIGGDAPVEECLRIAKQYLKPDGALVVAIENRLGLKYWNNCAEDHTGRMFDSVHDSYSPGTVATFGREELKNLLTAAGFGSAVFFFPFPDYKLPSVVVRESALQHRTIDFAGIIGQPRSRDYSGQPHRHFSERLAWRTLEKNGLIPHLAHSFLVVCAQSEREHPLADNDWLVKIYNSDRSACYRTETTIYQDTRSNAIRVSKEKLYAALPEHAGPLAFNRDVEQNYIHGSLLSDELLLLMQQPNPLPSLFRKLKEYKNAVLRMSSTIKPDIRPGMCPGELVDCTPFNLIRSKDGLLHYIDNEWIAKEEVPLNFVLLRGVFGELIAKISYFNDPSPLARYATLKEFLFAIFRNMDQPLTENDIEQFCLREAAMQAQISDDPQSGEPLAQLLRERFTVPLKESLRIIQKISVNNLCKLLSEELKARERMPQTGSVRDAANGTIAASPNRTVPGPKGAGAQPRRNDVLPGCVSIVILTINQLNHTKECVESIQRRTPELHEIIFVDNGSTDGTVKWLRQQVKEHANYRLIENEKNLGFAKGCNQGMAEARGAYLLLLNNDVVVTAGWLNGLRESLDRDPVAGIVGPLTNNISGIQKDPNASYKDMQAMQAYADAFRARNRHRRIPLTRIVGFCMLFRRDLFETIGGLDEQFGSGNFEDDDFCLRARLAGFRNHIAGDVFIHHYGSRSFIGNKIDYRSTLTGNRKLFSQKWSGIPSDSITGKTLIVTSVLDNAQELADRGRIDAAISHLASGIGKVPDQPDLYHALAEILLDAERYQEALDALNTMPGVLKREQRSLVLFGTCQEGLGLLDAAERSVEQALQQPSSDAAVLNLKGRLAHARNQTAEAASWFQKAIDIDPGFGEPHTNLGIVTWLSGAQDNGISLMERGFILSPTSRVCAARYHEAITELQALGKAEAFFIEALALHPVNRRLAFLCIDLFIRQEKFDRAMQEIERAMAEFDIEDGLLSAALAVREKIGAKQALQGNTTKGSLAVSMIVRNEEKNIVRCLLSVKPIADEMIVVDTGSSDRTRDIAKALGAQVYDLPWSGDFAAARNFSLSKATAAWVLSLDADEVISELDHARLKEVLRASKPAAYSIVTRNYTKQVGSQGFISNNGAYPREEAGMGWFPSEKVRLFPNQRAICFENPVHEFVEGTVRKAGLPIHPADIPVHHYGRLDAERLAEKGESYYLIGKKKLEEKGGNDPKALFELAVQAGELKKFEEARLLFEKLVSLNPRYPFALFNLGFTYMELGLYQEALETTRKAYDLDPEHKECSINYAHCEIVSGDINRGVTLLETVLKKVPEYAPALAVLSTGYYLRDRKEEGLKILADLSRKGFNCTACLHDIAQGLHATGRFKEAVAVIEAAAKSKNVREDTSEILKKSYDAYLQAEERHC